MKESEPFSIRLKGFWDVANTRTVSKHNSCTPNTCTHTHACTSFTHTHMHTYRTLMSLAGFQVLENLIPTLAHENDGLIFSPALEVRL